MVASHYEVCAQKIVSPALQLAQDSNKFSVGSIVVLFRYQYPVGQVLHWQPGLPIVAGLHQSGANCIVTRIDPHFMGLLLVEDLQNRSRRQGFLQGLKCSFFCSFPFELDGLLHMIGEGLGSGGESLDEPPVEVCKSQEPLQLTHAHQSWP